MKELAKLQDSPTHRLSVKLDDGTFKLIYLRKDQAKSILKNINSRDQFIVIEEEAHPKFSCRVVKLTEKDKKELIRKHELAIKIAAWNESTTPSRP